MSGSELISFKVYFDKGDGSENSWEVRRFGIEHDVATNFSYLTEKLKSVFPCLRNASNIHVYWKDAENDCVKISSDAELIIALTETEQPIKKLYIKVLSNDQDDDLADHIQYGTATINCSGDGWPEIHPGIICDSCDGSVTGFRYKCLQCPDFDLCATCEAKSFHPEHYMLRMPTSIHVDMKKLGASIKKGKCNSHQKWGNAVVSVPSFASGGCPFARKHKKHLKRCNPGISVDTAVSNLLPLLDKVCISVLQGLSPPQPNNASQQQQSNSDNRNNHADERKTATAPSFPATSDDCTSHLTPENISKKENDQNVSFHSHMFKPQATSSAVNCENSSGNKNNNGSSSNENKNTMPNFNRNAGDNDPQDILTKIVNSFIPVISEVLKQDVTKVMNNYNQNTGTAPESNSTDKDDSSKNAVSATNTGVDLSEGTDGMRVKVVDEQVVQQKDDENGWTLLSREIEKDTSVGKSTGAIPKTKPNENKSTDDNYDRLLSASTDNGNEKSNSNRIDPDQEKLERSLKSMLDMGFTNEGNWLGQLLKNNGGNVAKVIELLTVPANKGY